MTTRRSQVQVLYGPPIKKPYLSRSLSLEDKALLLVIYETFPRFSPSFVFLTFFTYIDRIYLCKTGRFSGVICVCRGGFQMRLVPCSQLIEMI